MKKFNFSKGLVIGLLTLALCLTCFGVAKVSAEDAKPQVTFKAYMNGDVVATASYDNGYVAAAAAVTAGWYKEGESSPTGAVIKNGETTITEGTFKIVKTTVDDVDTYSIEGKDGWTVTGYSGDTVTVTYKAAAAAVTKVEPEIALSKILDDLGKANETIYILTGAYELPNGEQKFDYDSTEDKFVIKAGGNIEIQLFVKNPEVTFTVKLDSVYNEAPFNGKTYTFTTDASEFLKKDSTLTLDAILEGATTKVDDKDVHFTSEDNTAASWIINTNTDKTLGSTFGLPSTEKYLKYDKATRTYSVKKDLAEDETVTIWLAPATIRVTFFAADGVYTGYKSVIEVPNGAKTKINFTDISAGFKKLKDGSADEYDVLVDHVIIGGLTADYTKAYSSLTYEVDCQTALLTNDPDPETDVELAPAFDPEVSGYDPATDSLYFESPVNLTIYWADVKKAGGAQLKNSQLKTLAMTKVTKDGETYFTASIPLNDKTAGVKIAESKTAYIYVSPNAPAGDEKTKAKYTANYVVEATPYKKVAVTFAYAWVDKDSTEGAIAAVTVTGTDKKTVIYSGDVTADHANGLDAIISKLQYSTDGTTWYKITGNPTKDDKGKALKNDLNLGMLYELVNGTSKTTLYFRIKGEAALPAIEAIEGAVDNPATEWVESEGRPAKNAYRACKPAKANVAPAKEAKAVKVNVATSTLALKNGYDFAITDPAAKGAKEPSFLNGDVIVTILPFNKAGAAKDTVFEDENDTEGTKVDTATIDTIDFVPSKKCTKDTEGMFTKIKVKALDIDKIAELTEGTVHGSGKIYLWVRKSASEAKPAEKWTLITLDQIKDKPSIANEKGATYYIAQDKDDTKGVIAAPEIKSATGDTATGYEYLIVDAKDIVVDAVAGARAKIDFTSAKWTAINEKGLTVGKSKSKYAVKAGDKPSDHVLKDGSVILVRRAGDKSSSLFASDYLVTMVVKEAVTLKVENAEGKKEDKEFNLFVWKAYSAQ